MKFAVIFGAPILKNISERLLLSVIITEKKFLENLETLRNRSTSCEDCFLGTVESDRKKKIFSYHEYENFKPFGCGWFWVVVGGFG